MGYLVINVIALIEVRLQGTLVEIYSKDLRRDPIYTIAAGKFNQNRLDWGKTNQILQIFSPKFVSNIVPNIIFVRNLIPEI